MFYFSLFSYLFFIFVYYQLSLIRNAHIPRKRLFEPLNFALSYKNGLAALSELKKQKIISLAVINFIWVVYYAIASLILLLSIDRLMGDCDISDIVCACNSSLYINPFLLLIFIASIMYINSIYISNK